MGRTAYHLDGLMIVAKRCQMVEDSNLQLGSDEWLIRRHL
jgi:hypothetical protein